jgi:hypothetical protein
LTASLNKFGRFSSALGGFLIFLGIVIIGIFALALFGFIDITIFKSENYRALIILILLVISVLDIISGIILAFR